MLCCPLTTQIKNYPFEVFVGGTPPSAALADQVKSLDWRTLPPTCFDFTGSTHDLALARKRQKELER